MRRVECNLLDLGEVVLRILVQGEFTNLAEGELRVRPNVSQVEDIDALLLPYLLGLLRRHSLHLDGPLWEVAVLDGVEEILLSVVG